MPKAPTHSGHTPLPILCRGGPNAQDLGLAATSTRGFSLARASLAPLLGLVCNPVLGIQLGVLTTQGTLPDDESKPKNHEGLDGVHDDLDGEVRRVSQEAYGFVDVVGIDWLFANPL